MRKSIPGLLLLVLLLSAACGRANGQAPAIARHPPAAAFDRGSLDAIPAYDPDSGESWQVDLRGHDLSALDLQLLRDDLLYASFDDGTVWPAAGRMPQGFDPQRILELGKSPGLGVRELHRQGITGRGVGIAILDQMLPGGAGRARDHARALLAAGAGDGTDGDGRARGPELRARPDPGSGSADRGA